MLKSFYRILLLSFIALPAFAYQGHPYVGGMLGASIGKVGQTYPQIRYVSGTTITDSYPINNNHISASFAGVNGGYEFLGERWMPAIALGVGLYSTLSEFDIHGQVTEQAGTDASFTLYDYKYNINSMRAMAEVQFTWLLGKFAPFVNFGVGPSWNHTGDYQESPVNSTGFTALSPFQSRTNTNLAYQAGFGISTGFNFSGNQANFKQERVSLGYRYVDWGNASLGTRGSSYPYQLNVGRLKTYDVFISFTHLFT